MCVCLKIKPTLSPIAQPKTLPTTCRGHTRRDSANSVELQAKIKQEILTTSPLTYFPSYAAPRQGETLGVTNHQLKLKAVPGPNLEKKKVPKGKNESSGDSRQISLTTRCISHSYGRWRGGGGGSAPPCILVAVVQPRFLLFSPARQRAEIRNANYNSRGAERDACALTLGGGEWSALALEGLRGRVSAWVERCVLGLSIEFNP